MIQLIMSFYNKNELAKLFDTIQPNADEAFGNFKLDSNVYAIFITPRIGSTFLTHLIKNSGGLGDPDEWFNYDSVRVGKLINNNKITSLVQYIYFLAEKFGSANGAFGVEFAWPHYSRLDQCIDLQSCFEKRIKYFYLRRRNIVQQAISWYAARESGLFHSSQNERETKEVDAFDEKKIKALIDRVLKYEYEIEIFFVENNIEPIYLEYEQITSNPTDVLFLFANVLGVDPAKLRIQDESKVEKLGGELSLAWEQRFYSANKSFVDRITANRGIRSLSERVAGRK